MLCACDCGKEKVINLNHMRSGKIVSCGCYRDEQTVARETTHGHSNKSNAGGSRTYKIWRGIWKRCKNSQCKAFANYGGRGITICERWKEFNNFLQDLGEIPSPLSVDRIDPDGNYEPGNVRLATRKEQACNRRRYILEGAADRLDQAFRPRRIRERHGYSGTHIYIVWVEMRRRCYDPKATNFINYGGRGINVCERWHSFLNFLADMGDPAPGHSLDRIDVHGNYCPENCRWATATEQGKNRRNRIFL